MISVVSNQAAAILIINKSNIVRIGDIVNHYTADTLKAYKGIGFRADLGNSYTFSLRAFGTAAGFKAIALIVCIEQGRYRRFGRSIQFKIITAVEDFGFQI